MYPIRKRQEFVVWIKCTKNQFIELSSVDLETAYTDKCFVFTLNSTKKEPGIYATLN
jgi:hypothetical protein